MKSKLQSMRNDASKRPSKPKSGSLQSQHKEEPSASSSGDKKLADRMDQCWPFWNSMSLEKKQSLLEVPVSELDKVINSISDDVVKKTVLNALSFVQINKAWKFWACCNCNAMFLDSESHMQHVRKKHIGNLPEKFEQILPQEVDSNWVEMLLKCAWKPVEASAAVKMIEDQSKCQFGVPVDGSDIAGSSKEDYVIDDFCSKDTSDACLDEGKIEPSHEESKAVDNGSIIGNRDHDDISNGELMTFEFNEWSKVYSLAQSWPLSSDSERGYLLERIHDRFKMLLSHKYLATSELTKVIQYTMEKLQGLAPKSQLLNHCLAKTPLGICFLEAPQLKEVLKQLQEYSQSCMFPRNNENISIVDEKHTDTQNSEVNERIVLTDGLLRIIPDERLLCNPGNPEKSSSSESGATETSAFAGDCKDGAFADSDALLSSIFSGTKSTEQWVSWILLQRKKGMEVLKSLNKEFSNLQTFCERKFICLWYVKALEGMETDEAVLEKRKLVERDKIMLDAISNVLKEAKAINLWHENLEPLLDASSRVHDLESGKYGDGKAQDCLDQNDTRIKETIQRQKNARSVMLSKIDASIMHSVTVRQQLELKLGSLSYLDYQTLMLPSVKTIIQSSLEDLVEKDATEKSDAVKEALLAERKSLCKGGHHSNQTQEKSKNKKKKKKKKKKKNKNCGEPKNSKIVGDIETLVRFEETAEQGHDFPIASDQDSNQKMGAGRKAQMLSLAEEDQQFSNSVDNYRNLGENDLGGVIFGCTDYTIDECHLTQIFGLPSQHLTYVKNITPGLSLFLFNYSDRKLHGIFEAACSGKMNINPCAWSVDGSERTQFPAQVSFIVRTNCQPLPEELFKPIIIVNYYTENLFMFELDRVQAGDLISLFKSSPTRGSTSTISRVLKDAPINESKDSPASISKVDTDAPSAYLEVESGFPHDAYKWKSVDLEPGPNARSERGAKTVEFPFLGPSSITVNEENQMLETAGQGHFPVASDQDSKTVGNISSTEDFKQQEEELRLQIEHEAEKIRLDENLEYQRKIENEAKQKHVVEQGHFPIASDRDSNQKMRADKKSQMLSGEKNQQSSSSIDNYRNLRKKDLGGVIFSCTTGNPTYVHGTSEQFTYMQNMEPDLPLFIFTNSDRKLHGIFETASPGLQFPALFCFCIRMQCQPLPEERFSPIISDNYSVENDLWFELDHAQASGLISLFLSSSPTMGSASAVSRVPMDAPSTSYPSNVRVNEQNQMYEDISINNSSSLQSLVNQLRQEIRELKDLSVEQLQKTTSLERKLIESDVQVQGQFHQLKGLVKQLESQLNTSSKCVDEPLNNLNAINQTLREPFDELRLGVDELVFILGGYDGTSWLSSLDCFSPSRDIVKSLKPMSCTRSVAASATLNGDIYIFGGKVSNRSLYHTVESFNPLRNEWTSRPSLSEIKASLAGATLHSKIYAIGGGIGTDYFSDVEMFDLSIGRWIPAQSMLQKRKFLAAAELNGAIYAVGGYDGDEHLKSAERFDPREPSWSRLESMNTRRACLSLAVLNEKLYALGGFDGEKTVPSVEVFDPRIGTWMAGDEMKQERRSSASTVMGGTIYALGGVSHRGKILDTVECYKEGQGWQLTNLKGMGKRGYHCCCSLSWLQP